MKDYVYFEGLGVRHGSLVLIFYALYEFGIEGGISLYN